MLLILLSIFCDCCHCSYFSLGLAYTLNKQYSEAINVSVTCAYVTDHDPLCTHVGLQQVERDITGKKR